MTWLITGGAGYIGSHVVRAMLAGVIQHGLHGIGIGHVGTQGNCPAVTRQGKLSGAVGAVQIIDDNTRAFTQKSAHDVLAQTPTTAGNQYDLLIDGKIVLL